MSRTLWKTSLAVTGAAALGSVSAGPGSTWYERLDKPSWQPPPAAFPLVWTPLYGLIAYAGARALDRAGDGAERGRVRRALAADLVLNAAWTPLFFAARKPRAALAEIAVLNAANAVLVRRAWRADRAAGALLLPYAGWTAFATALNAAIVRRNP
ncbi:TspO/MBR family protein [Actinomadura parmotrematis]|uniref:Tryptophan-rich sensory protein n=1 Tax=Actinomadura parmotrematis TaxID=2864039 RepID=A0ABS7G487_9ACTN|nr:TspO/MBR family protein [Actinomadura parmotrematis]MBW8487535.1 tryptophan-rich sensory protein [Actinomadura parmotrematis]